MALCSPGSCPQHDSPILANLHTPLPQKDNHLLSCLSSGRPRHWSSKTRAWPHDRDPSPALWPPLDRQLLWGWGVGGCKPFRAELSMNQEGKEVGAAEQSQQELAGEARLLGKPLWLSKYWAASSPRWGLKRSCQARVNWRELWGLWRTEGTCFVGLPPSYILPPGREGYRAQNCLDPGQWSWELEETELESVGEK